MAIAPATAQDSQPVPSAPAKPAPQPYGGGTPLDVIMHTKFWVDPPPMASFVKAARPPAASLDYTPTTGTEPKRPPLQNAAGLQQMEDELENAGVHNEKAAGFRKRHFKAVSLKKPKTPPKKTKPKLQASATPAQAR